MSDPVENTPEQQARDLLERLGIEDAQSLSCGDVTELANLLAERRQLKRLRLACQALAHELRQAHVEPAAVSADALRDRRRRVRRSARPG